MVTGSRYLGCFISDQGEEETWIEEKVDGWALSVRILSGVSHRHLYTAYDGLQKSIHQDWAFVQRVAPNVRDTFGPVEDALQDYFLTAFFRVIG